MPKNADIEQYFVGIDIHGYKIIFGSCYIPSCSDSLLYEKHCDSRWFNDQQGVNSINIKFMANSEFNST